MHALEHDRHLVFTKQVRDEVRIISTHNGHALNAEVPFEVDRLCDGTGIVGVHVETKRAVKKATHAFVPDIGQGTASCRCIGLCFSKKALNFMPLLVVGLSALDVHLAILSVTVVRGRPIEMDAIHHHHGGIFPIPAIKMNHST